MDFKSFLNKNIVLLDGAMGTQLQALGLTLGELPERWNLTHPEKVEGVHRAYFAAGADVVYANTFGANCLKFGDQTEEVVASGVKIAKRAAGGAEVVCPLPALPEPLMPLVSVIPLQQFACRMCLLRGFDPDRPRNLAKSVTVE